MTEEGEANPVFIGYGSSWIIILRGFKREIFYFQVSQTIQWKKSVSVPNLLLCPDLMHLTPTVNCLKCALKINKYFRWAAWLIFAKYINLVMKLGVSGDEAATVYQNRGNRITQQVSGNSRKMSRTGSGRTRKKQKTGKSFAHFNLKCMLYKVITDTD